MGQTTHQEVTVQSTPLAINFITEDGNKRFLLSASALQEAVQNYVDSLQTVTVSV